MLSKNDTPLVNTGQGVQELRGKCEQQCDSPDLKDATFICVCELSFTNAKFTSLKFKLANVILTLTLKYCECLGHSYPAGRMRVGKCTHVN